MGAERVVSLIASSTEIVCALGLESRLVGRSHECDYPESVKSLPVLTSPRLNPNQNSAAIDAEVKSLLAGALSIYDVDPVALKAVRPDLILTQTQCEVCAVSEKDVEKALCSWTGSRPRIVSLRPDSLGDVMEDVCKVAVSLGAEAAGVRLVDALKSRIGAVRDRASAASVKPRVACIEWIEPLMAAGNWVPELVSLAGGENLFGESGKHSPWMSFEDLERSDPDLIIILPCGFDLARTRAEMAALSGLPRWGALRAARENKVYLADGNQFFNRPGPRLAESAQILAEIFHPDLFEPSHEGTAWERW